MTTGPNRIMDEFAKLMTDAAGAAQGVKREAEEVFRAQGERVVHGMDLVKREEFDVLLDRFNALQEDHEKLKEQLAALTAGK